MDLQTLAPKAEQCFRCPEPYLSGDIMVHLPDGRTHHHVQSVTGGWCIPSIRFLSRTSFEPSTECRVWMGYKTSRGYGRLSYNGKLEQAHRVAWMLFRGPIPPGVYVLHTCDNPPCVAVRHLYLGNQSRNMLDAVQRGRNPNAQKTHCPQGHPYEGGNLYKDKTGRRKCKICLGWTPESAGVPG